MNTEFSYMYRDASNWKAHGRVVFAGVPEGGIEQGLAVLREVFDDGEYFIADQIRIPEVFLWDGNFRLDEDDDHCWHEFFSLELMPNPPTDEHGRTIGQFLDEAIAAHEAGWKAFDPRDRAKAEAVHEQDV